MVSDGAAGEVFTFYLQEKQLNGEFKPDEEEKSGSRQEVVHADIWRRVLTFLMTCWIFLVQGFLFPIVSLLKDKISLYVRI